MLHEIGC